MSWTMIMLVLSATVLFWMGVAVLAALVVQLIILSLTQRRLRLLRWAPLTVPALLLWCDRLIRVTTFGMKQKNMEVTVT